jgi:hypothetical protein
MIKRIVRRKNEKEYIRTRKRLTLLKNQLEMFLLIRKGLKSHLSLERKRKSNYVPRLTRRMFKSKLKILLQD